MRQGLTLIELLISFSIMALLALVSLTTFSRYNSQLVLTAAAKTTASELRRVQASARLTHTYQTADLARLNLPQKIKITSSPNIIFAASGYPLPGSSGTVVLQNNLGQKRKIIIASSGRIRIE